MKKCEHIRDLILTDYIDGQLDKNSAAGIESHLLDCSDCRDFFKEVRNSSLPFRQAAQQPVPAQLWTAIRQKIDHEKQGNAALENFIEGLRRWMVFPRLVPIFASFILMFLAGSVTLNTIQLQQTKEKDQGEYLVSLLGPAGISASTDSSEGATPIEHYFL